MGWLSKPRNAWRKFVVEPNALGPGWIEDSKAISDDISLSKRELFGLILLARAYTAGGKEWRIGYDPTDEEPNDGFIAKGKSKIRAEHKLIAQMEKKEVLAAILDTYKKAAAKGGSYGKDRVLLIHPNKASDHGGMIKISTLRDEIGEESPFDKVLTIGIVATKGDNKEVAVVHLIQHYPPLPRKRKSGSGIIQVDFNLLTGEATVPHAGFNSA